MINKSNQFLLILLPFFLIVGPALINISISIVSILTLIIFYREKKFTIFKNYIVILFLIWCAYLILNSLFSNYPYLSLEGSLFYFRYGILVLAISYYFIFNKTEFIKYFFISISICFLLLFVDSIYQLLFNKNILGYSNDDLRITSFFMDENILGSYLSRTLPLFIALYFILFKSMNKYLELTLMTIILLTIFMVFISGERTAFFINIVSLSLIMILTNNKFNYKFIIFVLILISIFIVNYFKPQVKHRMIITTIDQLQLYKSEGNILNSIPKIFTVQHEVIFKTAYKIYLDNKIFGIGPKNFREECKLLKYKTFTNKDSSVDGCNSSPHNIYLQLLSEVGLVGFFFVAITWLVVLYSLAKVFFYKFFRNTEIMHSYQICIIVLVFINLFPIIPTGNFFNSYLSSVLYLPLGFLHLFNKKSFSKYD